MSIGIKDFYRGDSKTINMSFKDNTGNPIDLTGATIWFTVKRNPMDLDSNAVIQKEITSHTDATNGLSTISLAPTDTNDLEIRSYNYDIQLVDSIGKVTTIIVGTFKLLLDITRSV